MKKNIVSTGILLTFFAFISGAQNVGINTTGAAPDAGAGLDVNFNNKGVLIPRVNIVDLNTIAPVVGSATESMLVYNTNTTSGVGYHYWDGSSWVRLVTNGEAWSLFGNGGTNAATNFLGTTDGTALRIRTNNINRFEYTTDGRLRSFNQGSAASPTYSWTGDVNTGIWRPGNDLLAFSTNGLERMRIDNNGSVGIGTTTPFVSPIGGTNVQRLQVSSNATPAGSGMSEFINSSVNGTAIGVSNTNTGNNQAALEGSSLGNGTGLRGLHIPITGNGIGTSGSSNSNTGIGVLGVNSGGNWAVFAQGPVASTVGFAVVSDKKFKRNPLPINTAIESISLLMPVSYEMNSEDFSEMQFNNKINYGFIAQDVLQVFPDLVIESTMPIRASTLQYNEGEDYDKGEDYTKALSINYIGLIPILTKAIQEQQEIIINQNDKIEALEQKVKEILSRIE